MPRAKVAASNAEISELLRRYSATLAVGGGNRFKIKAYRRAAETIENSAADLADMVRRGEPLTALPGIGSGIEGVIRDIVRQGRFAKLDTSLKELAPELSELVAWPRLDPKTVRRVYKKLAIHGIKPLRRALESGQIGEALGARVEFHIRQGLSERPRLLLWAADKLVPPLVEFLEGRRSVSRVMPAGGLRRRTDTVGDLDFLVTGKSAAPIWREMARFPAVKKTLRRSTADAEFLLASGVVVHLHHCRETDWGTAAIQYTGSERHNRRLAKLAGRKPPRTNGRKPSPRKSKAVALADDPALPHSEEREVYRSLGLPFIEPELREDRGEIEAARSNCLPRLVTAADIQGDLHMHTTESDGADDLATMVRAAQERGYRYIAITDHSQSLTLTNGLTEARLRRHLRKIDRLNAKLKDFVILKSAEVDILEDGRLDYSQGMLKELDLTICSIHSRFALDKKKQTERILRAMDNRYFNILGHATGRLLLKREGYEIDAERILKHAKKVGCHVEINSSPDRLDLNDENAKLAKELGVLVAVNTDAHSVRELGFLRAGINQARRAWLEPPDVLNTRPLPDLRRALER
jgi:DNA polymerase (family X)